MAVPFPHPYEKPSEKVQLLHAVGGMVFAAILMTVFLVAIFFGLLMGVLPPVGAVLLGGGAVAMFWGMISEKQKIDALVDKLIPNA